MPRRIDGRWVGVTNTPKWAETARRNDLLVIRTLTEDPGWYWRSLAPRIEIDAATGCHIWLGGTTGNGYGRAPLPLSVAATAAGNSVIVLTHRVAKIIEIDGPIPYGMVTDHTCRNRRCASASHLEVVTVGENLVAPGSLAPAAANAAKVACRRGHDLTDPRNWVPGDAARGRRGCLACLREARQLRSAAHKALGITQREYVAIFGESRTTAERVIATSP
jgi:hypothetical protein